MLILTCGIPSSGKSRAIDILSTGRNWNIIRPSDWVPDNLSTLGEDMERSYRIECWSIAIDKTREAIAHTCPKDVIVLDSGNSKYNTVAVLVGEAKVALHKVAVLFVYANSSLCISRNATLTESLVRNYVDRLKASLPLYKRFCDLFLPVQNNGTIEELESELHNIRNILCQNI